MARLSEYKIEYADKVIELMSQGMLDCELYNEFDCCKNTFLRWRKEYPDFNEAYERGFPKCESWWVKRMKQMWIEGNEKGFKYCALIMNTKFGYRENQSAGVTNNTQINIQGNMNVIESQSTPELIETLKTNFEFLKNNNVLDVKFLDVESDKQD